MLPFVNAGATDPVIVSVNVWVAVATEFVAVTVKV
jgi:hypothetical protein